nr:anthranilate synthase/indole-3-glycerol phosphate synthase/phosphoribosylanthranilate isomerase [Cryptococcus depauperatus CBS 7855]
MGFTLLIDNYDSFTWNIYADLVSTGGDPFVVRNDKITLAKIQDMFEEGRLSRIVISPGPGHPKTDSGISRDVIKWGMGRLPILGVCMGLECIVDALGGEVSLFVVLWAQVNVIWGFKIGYAGEIMHGKTSLVQHDALGIFHNLPPLLSSTRYHSLAASVTTLPSALQVTSTAQESGVIMGIRHRRYTVEAVQYHPESCMSEGGKGLLVNFLKLKGGYWGGENSWCGILTESETSAKDEASKLETKGHVTPGLPTILNRIHAQRLLDVKASSSTSSSSPANVQKSLSFYTSPPYISFPQRIASTPHTAIMAEIKRASPSKGDIAPDVSAPEQALKYALAGASVISVLTEPTWFKGGLDDMLAVRQAVDSLPDRPAILRKDFIISKYMIDEARLYGADTVLLIVAMLEPALLKELYDYSVSIGMEPLVEVNNPKELSLALDIGAKVVGVNNRNLHDFNVDMSTTSRVNAALNGRSTVLCALSGISSPEDVEKYVAEGVKAVLVGEALMRASDTKTFLRSLIGLPPPRILERRRPLVKICGIRNTGDAKLAIGAGADLLGVILVSGTKRCISPSVAQEISAIVRSARSQTLHQPRQTSSGPEPWFATQTSTLFSRKKPLLVGVFQNQPLSEIISAVDEIGLDLVQLHGDEPQSWAKFIPVPVIKVFRIDSEGVIRGGEVARPGLNNAILLDAGNSSGGGGEGKSFDWSHAKRLIEAGEVGSAGSFRLPIMLAGGLNPENVNEAVKQLGEGVWCVDVSSGVEGEDGTKDEGLVKGFVKAVKG